MESIRECDSPQFSNWLGNYSLYIKPCWEYFEDFHYFFEIPKIVLTNNNGFNMELELHALRI